MPSRHHEQHHFGPEGLLHAVRLGPVSAQPIVFLHGITGSRRYFQRRVAPLAGRYRVIIPDLLGFGLSPKPPVDYTMQAFTAALGEFLQHEGVAGRRQVLVGHSLGALIAIEYAIAHPGQVAALVLINLPRHTSAQEAHDRFWLGSSSYRKLLNEHSLAENLAQMKRMGFDLVLRHVVRFPWGVVADCRKFTMRSLTSTLEHSLLNYRLDDVLPKLPPTPVLLIHGMRDPVAPFANIADLPARYPFMRLVVVPSSGHHVFLTHTRRCLRAMEDFLSSPGAGAGPGSEPVDSVRDAGRSL